MLTTSSIRSLLAVLSVVALLTSCGLLSRRVKLGEEFTMKVKEKVVVAGAGLEIRLEGVGHQTFPEPQPRPLRSSYVTIRVTPGPARSIEVSDRVDVGEYTIAVKSADPFASDGGPQCKLVVTRR
jgi:hypothetical protein